MTFCYKFVQRPKSFELKFRYHLKVFGGLCNKSNQPTSFYVPPWGPLSKVNCNGLGEEFYLDIANTYYMCVKCKRHKWNHPNSFVRELMTKLFGRF